MGSELLRNRRLARGNSIRLFWAPRSVFDGAAGEPTVTLTDYMDEGAQA
jgi:hypothetical protein